MLQNIGRGKVNKWMQIFSSDECFRAVLRRMLSYQFIFSIFADNRVLAHNSQKHSNQWRSICSFNEDYVASETLLNQIVNYVPKVLSLDKQSVFSHAYNFHLCSVQMLRISRASRIITTAENKMCAGTFEVRLRNKATEWFFSFSQGKLCVYHLIIYVFALLIMPIEFFSMVAIEIS